MKRIYLLIFIVSLCLQLSAGEDTTLLLKKMDTLNINIKTTNARVDTLRQGIEPLKDTIRKIVTDQLIVDASALDSARKFPDSVLYKTYLFSKKSTDKKKSEIKLFFAILAFIILGLMWYACINYSINDSLCKDVAFDKSGNRINDPKYRPFSYARAQLLWWTMIILSCYTFFLGVTGVLLPLNVTSVLLLGFGALVYGAGKIIDNRQIDKSKGIRKGDIEAQKKERPDFIKDILSDDNGISIHRFQAVVFNVVFGIGFIGFFIKSLINHHYPFPDFTDWQFALIGISSATYLGLKANENRSPENRDISPSLDNWNNESFTGAANNPLIEFHDDTNISNQPPAIPPPNIK